MENNNNNNNIPQEEKPKSGLLEKLEVFVYSIGLLGLWFYVHSLILLNSIRLYVLPPWEALDLKRVFGIIISLIILDVIIIAFRFILTTLGSKKDWLADIVTTIIGSTIIVSILYSISYLATQIIF